MVKEEEQKVIKVERSVTEVVSIRVDMYESTRRKNRNRDSKIY